MAWGCSESGFLDMGRSGRKACPLCGWLVHPGFAVGVVEQGMGGWVSGWVSCTRVYYRERLVAP